MITQMSETTMDEQGYRRTITTTYDDGQPVHWTHWVEQDMGPEIGRGLYMRLDFDVDNKTTHPHLKITY